MDPRLLKAATSGDIVEINWLIRASPDMLLGKTPLDNTALHIAVIFGHEQFAKELCSSSPSLLLEQNSNGETPLHIAAADGHHSMAAFFIQVARQVPQRDGDPERGSPLKEMVMAIDKKGNTALHQALRHGHSSLALELLQVEPELSTLINKNRESPMYMAAYRDLADAVTALVRLPQSHHGGPYGGTALHAATISGHSSYNFSSAFLLLLYISVAFSQASIDHFMPWHQLMISNYVLFLSLPAEIARILLEKRPSLSKAQNNHGTTPLIHAVQGNNLDMVQLCLSCDPSAAYVANKSGSAFHCAAKLGCIDIAEELIRHCPDCGFAVDSKGQNALHVAILEEQVDFVEYILRTPVLHGLLNQPSNDMIPPLHLAAKSCNPKILGALLADKRVDRAALNGSWNTLDTFFYEVPPTKTLKWNEAYTELVRAIPSVARGELWHGANKSLAKEAKEKIQSLTEAYTQNTTVMAILIATVTFAAAFTMPGGFSGNEGADEGLPILARKAAFKLFLISDTIAMCTSLAVSFFCIFAGWHDMDFLLHYRASTRKLLWCAFPMMSIAFSSAMFTVLAPRNLWLAILISLLCCILPFFTYLLSTWPLRKLYFRFGQAFRSDLLKQV